MNSGFFSHQSTAIPPSAPSDVSAHSSYTASNTSDLNTDGSLFNPMEPELEIVTDVQFATKGKRGSAINTVTSRAVNGIKYTDRLRYPHDVRALLENSAADPTTHSFKFSTYRPLRYGVSVIAEGVDGPGIVRVYPSDKSLCLTLLRAWLDRDFPGAFVRPYNNERILSFNIRCQPLRDAWPGEVTDDVDHRCGPQSEVRVQGETNSTAEDSGNQQRYATILMDPYPMVDDEGTELRSGTLGNLWTHLEVVSLR